MQRPNMNNPLWSMVIATILYMAKMKRVTIVMFFHTMNSLTINANNFTFVDGVQVYNIQKSQIEIKHWGFSQFEAV